MFSSSLLYPLLLCITGANAMPSLSPSILFRRDPPQGISQSYYDSLSIFSQYAGAAYCYNNVDKDNSNNKLTCSSAKGACPAVEGADTHVIATFDTDAFTWFNPKGYVAVDHTRKLLVVAFQGTNPMDGHLQDVISDLGEIQMTADLCGSEGTKDGCQVHAGFYKASLSARPVILAAVNKGLKNFPGYKVVATGHSLGGAVAALTTAHLRNLGLYVDLYTFGQPHIGAADISNHIQKQAPAKGSNYRVTHFDDPIPRFPDHSQTFRKDFDHFYPEFWIKNSGKTYSAGDIQIVTGWEFSDKGNEGTGLDEKWWVPGVLADEYDALALFVGGAHAGYFGDIGLCDSTK